MALLTLPDGRAVEVTDLGPPGAPAVVFHHGTPGAPLVPAGLAAAAGDVGLRVVAAARPGYAGSDPRPGRRVVDAAADTAAVADALGIGPFATLGWSGGGPHALACAARLGPRCRASAVLAGVGPSGEEGLDFLAGMGQDNLEEFAAAAAGPAVLDAYLEGATAGLATADVDEVIAGMASLLPPADVDALRAGMGAELVASFAAGLAPGTAGWRDDDLAFVSPWGFDPADITVPVALWQGAVDLMVPAAHARWLAGRIPGASLHATDDDGHLSLIRHAGEILAWLADRLA